MKAKIIAIVLLAGGILAGCGGGSGGSAGTPATVTINSTNQATVTKSALSVATQNLGSSLAASVGGVQTSTSPSNDRILFNMADFALQQMAQNPSTTTNVSGVVTTTNCSSSGTSSVDTDGTASTAATYWTATYNNCVFTGSAYVYNGTISITGISSTSSAFSATLAFNFNATSGGTTVSNLVGGFTLTETGKGTATQINTLSGTSLVLSASSGSFSLTGAAGTNGFNFTDTFNSNAVNTTTPVIHSNAINFAVAITDKVTPANSFAFSALTTVGQPLVKSSAENYLRSGQIVVTGAASTAIRVTILPASSTNLAGTSTGQLTIELSTDGGKTWGTATTKTWGTL